MFTIYQSFQNPGELSSGSLLLSCLLGAGLTVSILAAVYCTRFFFTFFWFKDLVVNHRWGYPLPFTDGFLTPSLEPYKAIPLKYEHELVFAGALCKIFKILKIA